MNVSTVIKLNHLNAQFYQKTAQAFSETRQQAWEGWEKSWESVAEKLLPEGTSSLSVCDLGCGNGRFASFCLDKLPSLTALDYLGIDQNSTFLAEAEQKFSQTTAPHQVRFQQLDIIDLLVQKRSLDGALALIFSLVTGFGLFHHIPSLELRTLLMQQISQVLSPGGICIVTFWQFHLNKALMERQLPAEQLGFTPEELEPNDYFLNWERGVQAVRYCHLIDTAEQDEIVRQSGLRVLNYFTADGKTGQDNNYYVLQKES